MELSPKAEKTKPARMILDEQKNFLADLNDDFQKLCGATIKTIRSTVFFFLLQTGL